MAVYVDTCVAQHASDETPITGTISESEPVRLVGETYNGESVALEVTTRFTVGGVDVKDVTSRIGSGYTRTQAVEFVPADIGVSGLGTGYRIEVVCYEVP